MDIIINDYNESYNFPTDFCFQAASVRRTLRRQVLSFYLLLEHPFCFGLHFAI